MRWLLSTIVLLAGVMLAVHTAHAARSQLADEAYVAERTPRAGCWA